MSVRLEITTIDWDGENIAYPSTHPVKMMARGPYLLNRDTGEVIATIADGYLWYWDHNHPHADKVPS